MTHPSGRFRPFGGAAALVAFAVLRLLAPVLGDRALAALEIASILGPLGWAVGGTSGRTRWIGLGAVFFVAIHLFTTRLETLLLGLPRELYDTILIARLSSTWLGIPWIALAYLVGIGLVAAHLALALSGQRRVSIAAGIALFALGAIAVVALATGTRLPPSSDDDSGAAQNCGR